MEKRFENKGPIVGRFVVKVSSRGAGVSLYISKSLCETFNIKPGDRLHIDILDHYVPKPAGGDKNAET